MIGRIHFLLPYAAVTIFIFIFIHRRAQFIQSDKTGKLVDWKTGTAQVGGTEIEDIQGLDSWGLEQSNCTCCAQITHRQIQLYQLLNDRGSGQGSIISLDDPGNFTGFIGHVAHKQSV
jgi:hypothetical protein